MHTKTILITGGSGFIGQGLIRVLRNQYPHIVIRILDVAPPAVPGVEFIEGSILDKPAVSRAVRGCNYVVHLAAMVGVRSTEADPGACWSINSIGTVNVLEASAREEIQHFVLASSSEVYGNQEVQPIAESSQLRPQSVYAESKIHGEECLQHFRSKGFKRWRIVRFFNVYGPNQREEFVVSRFIHSVMRGGGPTIFGPGTQIRSFCHVDDAARGCLLTLLAEDMEEWIFNIGNSNEPLTITELAYRVISAAGVDVVPTFAPFNYSDRHSEREIWSRIPEIARAATVLGYNPQVSLAAGLSSLLQVNGKCGSTVSSA